jgi:pimeloyl-ACP methyl ester carboxylesterase
VVFVANGSGGETPVTDVLAESAADEGMPLVVRTVAWARAGSILENYADLPARYAAAIQLAERVRLLNAQCPQVPIVLVGYSSGTHVVLEAAGMCPPGSVRRIVLLAAAVSTAYDLAPALRASRCGIDSFFSPWDNVLDFAEELGTADGQRTPTAGRVGFRQAPSCALRQYQWHEGMGGQGGHVGWTRTRFVRETLLPLLCSY